jgi:putative FmdB family regulatory protein
VPIYVFQCPICGDLAEDLRSIEKRDDAPDCPTCVQNHDIAGVEPVVSLKMKRTISPLGAVYSPSRRYA